MKRINVSDDNWKDNVLNEVLVVLKAGGIVMHPTETCYGLAVDVFNESALQKLYTLKKMDSYKPVSIIVPSLEDAMNWGNINEEAEGLIEKYWPGPYTFVVKRKDTLPRFFNKGIEKVGLRNPSLPSVLKMVEMFGRPVTTTSANISGRPETYDVSDFFGQIKGESNSFKPDLIIDAGFIGENKPSTVYDIDEDKCLRGSMNLE